MTIFIYLPSELLNIIYRKTNITCKTCLLQFSFNNSFYKKEHNNYYCSKLCYECI